MQDYIKIHDKDSVAAALKDLKAGYAVKLDGTVITLTEDIPRGHKFSIKPIRQGENIIKYGFPIGHAAQDILVGAWVHTHNIKTNLGDLLEYTYNPDIVPVKERKPSYFYGFKRENGSIGIRNDIWIIPTVGCVNKTASTIEKKCQNKPSGTVGKITAFNHPYGCSQMGEDQENTRKILAALAGHANAGGVLLLGLGCENSGIAEIIPYIKDMDQNRIKYLICQDAEDETAEAEKLIDELITYAGRFEREKICADELIIGMKCGGSDGLSGITANPCVGMFSDILTSQGGTTILTEVPEMFGAEEILMSRCKTKEIYLKTVDMINDFKNYYKSHNQTIYENPSPGNKKGGISTLEDKSLGCTQKSGSAPVKDVLMYGEPVKYRGLNLLSAPGNDLVASTALAASGAHMVLFTTGRGTPFACPVPTLKISTNTPLYQKKSGWIDFDCGAMIEGKSLKHLSEELFNYVLAVASGEELKSEKENYQDLAIFKQGVTL